jgi:hypothetical protein
MLSYKKLNKKIYLIINITCRFLEIYKYFMLKEGYFILVINL